MKPLEEILVHNEHINVFTYSVITWIVFARKDNIMFINSKKGLKKGFTKWDPTKYHFMLALDMQMWRSCSPGRVSLFGNHRHLKSQFQPNKLNVRPCCSHILCWEDIKALCKWLFKSIEEGISPRGKSQIICIWAHHISLSTDTASEHIGCSISNPLVVLGFWVSASKKRCRCNKRTLCS